MRCGLLFEDITEAFATLYMRVVFLVDGGDEYWLRGLEDVGFTGALRNHPLVYYVIYVLRLEKLRRVDFHCSFRFGGVGGLG